MAAMSMSRSFVSLVFVFTTACAATTPPPAVPAPAASGPLRADEMRGYADATCACEDLDCARPVLERAQAAYARPDAEPDDAEVQLVLDETARLRGCHDHLSMLATHAETLAAITCGADHVCTCGNAACAETYAEKAQAAVHEVAQVHDDSPEHAASDAAFGVQSRRAAACYAKLPGAADVAALDARIDRFADDVCACAHDASCIGAAATSFAEDTHAARALDFIDPDRALAAFNRASACGWNQE
jgi:hypothetical protein